MLLAAVSDKAYGKVYNIGGEGVISLKELAELLIRVNGSGEYTINPFPVERKRIDIGDYYANDQLIRSELGWNPQVTLEEGLSRTLEFYRRHLEHYL